jgi:hypothetical protein
MPKEELGGLSPVQISLLIHSDWVSSTGAIRLNPNLTLADLKDTRILANARLFLLRANDEGGIKATTTGNLNRKFVEGMLDQLTLPEGYVKSIRAENKVINELDLFPLHKIRLLLELDGLIRKTKGIFKVTKKGKDLLSDANAGELYAQLFYTKFRKFNLAYMHLGSERSDIQETIAFAFYQISKQVDDWKNVDTLPEKLFLPMVIEQPDPPIYEGHLASLCKSRILNPLEEFGLVEQQELPGELKWKPSYQVRKTELFDRFLTFDL